VRRSSSGQEVSPASTVFLQNQPVLHIFVKKNTFEFKGEDCGDARRTRTLQLRYRVVQWKEKVLWNHCSNIRWHTIFIHAINKRSWSCYSFTQEACQCSTFCAHIIRTIDVPWCETGVWHCSICLRMPHIGYPYHDFQEVYDQLYLILDGARCAGKQIVLGGNLNTKLHVGIRGEAVTIFSTNFELQIANEDDDEDVGANWTFHS